MTLEIGVLGDLAASRSGEPIDLGGKVLARVLLVLVAYAPRSVSLDELVDHVWGRDAPRTAEKAVRVHVGRLRTLLGRDAIATATGGYRFERLEALDVHRYESLAERARQTAGLDPERSLHELTEALSLWRSSPFADVGHEEWVAPRVHALEERYRADVEEHSELLLATGVGRGRVDVFRERVLAEPLRERRWAQLITALYRDGKSADAVRAFEEVRARFAEELGVRPGPLVQAAYDEAILSQQRRPSDLPTDPGPFVGRDAELGQVEQLLGDHRLVSVLGIGGIGKSRLAAEVSVRARARGDLTCILSIPDGDLGDRVGRELVAQIGPGASTEPDAIDALSRRLVGVDLVVFDGCERCLEPVRLVVATLLERRPRLRVLATTRQPLGLGGEVAMTLGPLDEPVVEELLGRRRGTANAAGEIDARRTAGIPLLVELAVRTGGRGGVPTDDRFVAASVAGMVTTLDTPTRRLAEAVATLPRGLTASLGKAIAGPAAETSLRQLAWLGLVTTETAGEALRYDMLDPVRSAVRAFVDAATEQAVIDAAVAHLTAFGRRLRPRLDEGPDYRVLGTIEPEAPTLRYLLGADDTDRVRLADGLAEFLALRGFAAEGMGWLGHERRAHDPLVAATAVLTIARIGRSGGLISDLALDLRTAQQRFVDAGDTTRAVSAALFGVTAFLFRGDIPSAERLAAYADEAATTDWLIGHAAIGTGMVMAMSGAPLDGRTVLAEAEACLTSLDQGAAAFAAYVHGTVGAFLLADDASEDFRRAAAEAEVVGDRPLAALCVAAELGDAARRGSVGLPERWRAAGLALEEAGLPERAAHAHREAGVLYLDGGADAEARSEFLAAARPLVRAGARTAPATLAALAALIHDDDADLAAQLGRSALHLPSQFGFPATPEDHATAERLLSLVPAADDVSPGSVDDVLALLDEAGQLIERPDQHRVTRGAP